MKARRHKGFVLLLVILLMVLIGSYLFVLADTANTMTMQADQAIARARSRNLIASGLEWFARNRRQTPPEDLKKGIDLDVSALRDGRLRVAMTEEGLCRIAADCRSGRFVQKSDEVFALDKDPSSAVSP